MGKTKHEKSFVDFDKPYEQNLIGLRGVIYFAVGLFLLCAITFGLMWLLLDVFETQVRETDDKARNPMQLTEKERLPSEPRLQSAPGFGVDTKDGRVNLELRNPQAEWETLQEVYKDVWENGQKGAETEITRFCRLNRQWKKCLRKARNRQRPRRIKIFWKNRECLCPIRMRDGSQRKKEGSKNEKKFRHFSSFEAETFNSSKFIDLWKCFGAKDRAL